ncbi:hypothetical protein [Chitinophaga silvatica]|nr:hypothetical protein [Chitinophaga silvatica]
MNYYQPVSRGVENYHLKEWSQIKTDTKEFAGNTYWGNMGTINGQLSLYTGGMYSRSAENFNLSVEQAKAFQTASGVSEKI